MTGRLESGTSIGAVAAVTDNEFSEVANEGSVDTTRTQVATRTAFGTARVQQEFGELASTASGAVGFLHRDLQAGDPLSELFIRNYVVVGGDMLVRLKGGEYEFTSGGANTFLSGEAAAIERAQRSSILYLQRPDRQDGRTTDPRLTSLNGRSVSVGLSRVNGEHWLFSVRSKFDSYDYEPNSLGRLQRSDGIEPNLTLRYRETRPGRLFHRYQIVLNKRDEWNWAGNRYSGSVTPSLELTWLNFWTTSVGLTYDQRAKNTTMTRGGPRIGTPLGWAFSADIGNSGAAQTGWQTDVEISRDEDGGLLQDVGVELSFRPDPRWELSVAPSYDRQIDTHQHVMTRAGGRAETFGNRYIFGEIERSELSMELRATLTLRPDMTLDAYAEPFAASGRYQNYGELLPPRRARASALWDE